MYNIVYVKDFSPSNFREILSKHLDFLRDKEVFRKVPILAMSLVAKKSKRCQCQRRMVPFRHNPALEQPFFVSKCADLKLVGFLGIARQRIGHNFAGFEIYDARDEGERRAGVSNLGGY